MFFERELSRKASNEHKLRKTRLTRIDFFQDLVVGARHLDSGLVVFEIVKFKDDCQVVPG